MPLRALETVGKCIYRLAYHRQTPCAFELQLCYQGWGSGAAAHLEMSSKAGLSSSDTIADSRSSSRPSDLRLVRWPPFLSAAVRLATCSRAK